VLVWAELFKKAFGKFGVSPRFGVLDTLSCS